MGLLERRRQWLLSLVLLAILVGSVLAAWSLVRSRQAPAARAKDLLRGIRDKTLSPYWGSQELSRWYLVRDSSGQAVGFMVRARKPAGKGYSGITLLRIGGLQQGESWTIDPAATQGFYTATLGGRDLPDTQITLRDGQVIVTKPWAGSTSQATSPVPANYIPEGLLPLLAAQVSRTSAEVRFCFTYNPESLVENSVHFTAVTLTPLGDGKVRLRSNFLQGQMDEVYHFDAAGELFRIDDNLTRDSMRLIDLRSLARLFPEVLEVQRRLEEESPEPSDDADIQEPTPLGSGEPHKVPV